MDGYMERPQRRVVCAACRCGDIIIAGVRHFDRIMISQIKAFSDDNKPKGSEWEQGFIDQFGTFMDRKEAMIIAKESGQELMLLRNGSNHILYSEGLY